MANKDKLKGGISDKMSVESIAKKHKVSTKEINAQIKMGIKVEMEHVDNKDLAREIALDHLFEMPDYYTRLNKMEKNAKKEGVNENITAYARRLRELAGLSEGSQNKSLKTIQEGTSNFDNEQKFYAKDMINSGNYKSYIDSEGDKIYDLSKEFSIGPTSIDHFIELAKENDKLYSFLESELSSNEGIDTGNEIFWGADIFDNIKNEPRASIARPTAPSHEETIANRIYEGDDFENHQFEQKKIEDGEDDSELYNLNENTIIVLDFLKEDFDE